MPQRVIADVEVMGNDAISSAELLPDLYPFERIAAALQRRGAHLDRAVAVRNISTLMSIDRHRFCVVRAASGVTR